MIAWPLIVYGRNDWIFGLFFYSLSAYNRACWTYYLGTFLFVDFYLDNSKRNQFVRVHLPPVPMRDSLE